MIVYACLVGFALGAFVVTEMTRKPETIGEWETTVTPAPQTIEPIYTWPPTPWVDAMRELAGVQTAHAAAHPVTADPPRENTYLYPTPLKLWTIEQQATDDNHISCSATRTLDSGATMSVRAYKNKTIELTLHEVNFGLNSEKPYVDAVVSIDGEPVDVTVAKRMSKWVTKFDLTETNLQELAKARILRLTVGAAYIELDLTGSGSAAKYVAMCNASGQNMVHRRIVEAAQPAEINKQ
jgi:hypothetical protein